MKYGWGGRNCVCQGGTGVRGVDNIDNVVELPWVSPFVSRAPQGNLRSELETGNPDWSTISVNSDW